MKQGVLAIGLDSMDPGLMKRWCREGHLPHLNRFLESAAYANLYTDHPYIAESIWTVCHTGCRPEKTGYWSPVKFNDGSYHTHVINAYNYELYPPFYANLGTQVRVCVFDPPQARVRTDIHGLQVYGWGSHSPFTPCDSSPVSILQDLKKEFGEHPAFLKDQADWWKPGELKRFRDRMLTGIERRTRILKHLLTREPWDLVYTVISEPHSAGHYFYHIGQPSHPLYYCPQAQAFEKDPLLEIYKAIDRSVGEILEIVPKDTYVLLFSVHGMGPNVDDVPSLALLSELLFRHNFPGKQAIAVGDPSSHPGPLKVGPLKHPLSRASWPQGVWMQKKESTWWGKLTRQYTPHQVRRLWDRLKMAQDDWGLVSPFYIPQNDDVPYRNMPPMWYRRLWSQMKAFAMPSFSDGFIRINLAEREPSGTVRPEDYSRICDELTSMLKELKNPRTGRSAVLQVIQPRKKASDRDPSLPDADLIVKWSPPAMDVIDSPTLGRVGPVRFSRTGGHTAHGFMMLSGPSIAAGSHFPDGQPVDISATILDLMGVAIPQRLDGVPLRRQTTKKLVAA